MLTRNLVKDIISLCKTFAQGKENGTITKKSYSSAFKKLHLKAFEEKYGITPNLILQNELKEFYDDQLKGLDDKLLCKNFGFWGNNIYSYVWTCVYYKFSNEALPASYSPQLYILVNKMGIKFGFCYGHQISENDEMVEKVKREIVLTKAYNVIQGKSDIYFFNSSQTDITARPEVLFGKNERIVVDSKKDISIHWSNKSLLIKEYPFEEVPENISEIIQNTLMDLKDIYLSLLPINKLQPILPPVKFVNFSHKAFQQRCQESNLTFSNNLILRFGASILSKPFIILTGLSGSGKTKLAQAFAAWICSDQSQYCIVPVGADWTNREPLLGFPNALEYGKYIKPDNKVLVLILSAIENPQKPYFLILDEMNLSHVERYFADFLSVMESHGKISLHSGDKDWNGVPPEIQLPDNLFVIGTVNIDETTYMFSPKVLDRASVIEFRITAEEMTEYLSNPGTIDLEKMNAAGSDMAEDFVKIAKDKKLSVSDPKLFQTSLIGFFNELKKTGAEFGYRSASEILRFAAIANKLEPEWTSEQIIDVAIMQKLLPKVHGSKRKLEPVLKTLGKLCLQESVNIDEYLSSKEELNLTDNTKVRYPVSLEKILRMYRGLSDNGFTSYAEA